jgi:hypothetical protein
MQELTELDSTADHTCDTPSIERWNVLEPITGRWSWLTVFRCCHRVAKEPAEDRGEDSADGLEQQAA